MVSPGKDPVFGFFQVPPGEAESSLCEVAFWFLHPACGSGGPYLGHVPSDQEPFRRAGCILSVRAHPIVSHLH